MDESLYKSESSLEISSSTNDIVGDSSTDEYTDKHSNDHTSSKSILIQDSDNEHDDSIGHHDHSIGHHDHSLKESSIIENSDTEYYDSFPQKESKETNVIDTSEDDIILPQRNSKKNVRRYISDSEDDSLASEMITRVQNSDNHNISIDNISTHSEIKNTDKVFNISSDDELAVQASEPRTSKFNSVIDIDSLESSNHSEQSHDGEIDNEALLLAKSEIGVGGINPIDAQSDALLSFKLEKLKNDLTKSELIYESANLEALPDHGQKLEENIIILKSKIKYYEGKLKMKEVEKKISKKRQSEIDINNIPLKPTTSTNVKNMGKKALETYKSEQILTIERLQNLHGSLVSRPTEDTLAEDPKGLKVSLMPHQKHALAWLLWRESQNPRGGILADDMGLGKTLTMISLIISTLSDEESDSDSDTENTWYSNTQNIKCKGGTLVVCPASLIAQWEREVKTRCKKNLLSIERFHGTNRETKPRRLARKDIVFTTYDTLSSSLKSDSCLIQINWKRVILDEAHTVRNHKSQKSEAVCKLHAQRRWALTGTPIQNKEMDLYALLKFLKCSPFDDLHVFKRWVDNKNVAGHQRLATVLGSVMLRRTKEELQSAGKMELLPEKRFETIEVTLDEHERKIYDKMLLYSRTLFAQFLHQQAEKNHMKELHGGRFDREYTKSGHLDTQFNKAQERLLKMHAGKVEQHDILELLLRLRQVCCHPSLIRAMLDKRDMEVAGGEGDISNASLLEQFSSLNMNDDDDDDGHNGNIGISSDVMENIMSKTNPIFNQDRKSTKIRIVLETVSNIVKSGDKVIIISQWTSLLKLIASYLDSMEKAGYMMFTGEVPIKDRQKIVEEFNSENGSQILLLSLTAGGVGLNLTGANHLVLVDMHWNPQLELQAQDRIYRVGQKKPVFVYRILCKDSIEERVKMLQDKKLELADNILHNGGKISSKLTIDDLKTLLDM